MRSRGPAFLFLAMLSAAIVFMISLAAGSENTSAQLIISLGLIGPFFALYQAINSNGERMLSIMMWLYTIFLLAIPGTIHAAKGQFPWYSMSYSENDILYASSLLAAFMTISVIFYLAQRGKPLALPSTHRLSTATIRPGISLTVSLALQIMAFSGFLILGPQHFLSRIYEMNVLNEQRNPIPSIIDSVARISGFLGFVTALMFLATIRGARFIFIGLITSSFIMMVLVNYPVNVTRFILAANIITIMYVYLPMHLARLKRLFVIAYLLGSATIFPLVSGLSRGERGEAVVVNPIDYYTTTSDFDGLQSIINVVRLVQDRGPSWGMHFLAALFVFVPRQMWPTKPLPTGAEAAVFNGYTYTNMSEPLAGEWYRNFGAPGVIIGAVLVGTLIAKGEKLSELAVAGRYSLSILFWGLVVGLSTIVARGSLLSISANVGIQIAMAALVGYICQKRVAKD